MASLSKGKFAIECNSSITNSSITHTTIDMNGGVIINGGIPVNGGDLVNKTYVDSLSSGIPIVIITLTSTNYTTILNNQYGDLHVSVKNLVTDGPSATFMVSKSESYRQACITRFTSSAGFSSNERLQIQWLPNSGIELKKTGSNYDGQYQVQYILNS